MVQQDLLLPSFRMFWLLRVLQSCNSLPHLSYSYSPCNGHPSQIIGRTIFHKNLLIKVLFCSQPTGGFLLLTGDGKAEP